MNNNFRMVHVFNGYLLQLNIFADRYTCLFVSIIIFLGGNAFTTAAFGQHHRVQDIYQVRFTDFQGARKNNFFPVYISVEVLYRVDSIVKIQKNKYKLKVITMVRVNKDQSFFDTSAISKENLSYLLEHEQGHVMIGYIAANLIERDLSAKVYTEDFIAEVKKSFLSTTLRYFRLNQIYDEQTDHSKDRSGQDRWNEKMKNMFNESYKAK